MKLTKMTMITLVLAMSFVANAKLFDGGPLTGPTTAEQISNVIAGKSNMVIVYPGDNLSTVLTAVQTGSYTAAAPFVIKLMPGSYTSVSLTVTGNHIIIDASMPGVVVAGAITLSGSPTGVYLYLWNHPSGTYPGTGITLTNATEV
jgi:hypothetical protein